MDSVIATRGLIKLYGARRVVDRLELSVPRGAIYALLGDNGAGKSTTIRMLTGLLQPDAGWARILGEDCWGDAPSLRHRVGYVPEKPRFYDWMTVRDIGWFTSGFHRTGYFSRYLEMTERFRLDRAVRLRTLSKGGYAKVGLALALASDPEVLILDEPTSGLDLFIRREFLASMVDLAGEGRTILISSHGIAEIERVASHVAIMAGGKLLIAAPIEEIRQRIVRVRLRHDGLPPEAGKLGLVLEQEQMGRVWQVVLQDPNRDALEELSQREDISDYEESSLSLEDIYTSVLARFHKPGVDGNGSAPRSRGPSSNRVQRAAHDEGERP
jgi:ABC-2 type transport system ATP-binding protein